MTKLRRPLPPELLVEMHKCLPLDNAIYVLVNVSKTFVLNNSTRMRRNIQRLKTSLNEYIGTLVNDEDDREKLMIYNDIEWKPELDVLFRYGAWLTSARELGMGWNRNIIADLPKNFVEELLLHLANSRSQMTLPRVKMNFGMTAMPIPTFLLDQLLNKKEQYQIGNRILFESIQLETDNGQILQIFDAEFVNYSSVLNLILVNKMDRNNWFFKIVLHLDRSVKFIERLEFSNWNMQSFDDIANFLISWNNNDKMKQNGNKLELTTDIYWNRNLDIFLRRGAAFSQFRHFKINERYFLNNQPKFYVDFLINSIANTKHPQEFLESIELNLKKYRFIYKISEICRKGISEEDGKYINFGGNLQIILVAQLNNKLEFTLANGPTNGAYLFDVEVQFIREGSNFVRGIKIKKRKIDEIVEMKCEDQIEQGMKRKATNDDGEEDGPTCSAKLMKQ